MGIPDTKFESPHPGPDSKQGREYLIARKGSLVEKKTVSATTLQSRSRMRKDEDVCHLRTLARGPGQRFEADRGCRKAEEDPVLYFSAWVLLRD